LSENEECDCDAGDGDQQAQVADAARRLLPALYFGLPGGEAGDVFGLGIHIARLATGGIANLRAARDFDLKRESPAGIPKDCMRDAGRVEGETVRIYDLFLRSLPPSASVIRARPTKPMVAGSGVAEFPIDPPIVAVTPSSRTLPVGAVSAKYL
jgi:hypothetical protein